VYSPKHVWCEPTKEEKETHWEVAARCSVSVGPAGLGPEVSRGGSSKITVEHVVDIAGMDEPEYDKDYPNKVIFEIDENEENRERHPKGAVLWHSCTSRGRYPSDGHHEHRRCNGFAVVQG
jgi:hypothetical protein